MPGVFPPVLREIPDCYWRDGRKTTGLSMMWGKITIPAQCLILKATGKKSQVPLHADIDASGWSPEVLRILLDFCVRLPFAEASLVALYFGVKISPSQLERLFRAYGSAMKREVNAELVDAQVRAERLLTADPLDHEQAIEALSRHVKPAEPFKLVKPAKRRIMALETDGVYVLGRPDGHCPGLELKTAALYNHASPKNRWMIADRITAGELLPMLAGLLALAGVTSEDVLVLVGDGAQWISNIAAELNAIYITDVFHACEYLDLILTEMGWDEHERLRERRRWYRGEVNARDWLKQHQPQPGITQTWESDAITALQYLVTRLDSMDYKTFKALGYPIGSGQIEGMNKNVIGTRMKRSGCQWSEAGSGDMAATRAQTLARNPITNYHDIRHQAYPHFQASLSL